MGKALADPLLWFLVAVLASHLATLRHWRALSKPARAGLVLGLCAAAGLWLLGTHAAESILIKRLSAVHPIPAAEDLARVDVVVVLSGSFVDAPLPAYDQLDAWTTARVIQGVRAFFASDARLLVMTGRWARSGAAEHRGGSAGVDEDPARMANMMKELAVALGVPEDRVVVEPNARTTREHPLELQRLGVVEPGDTIGVITSSWHLPRAVREFEKLFPDVVPVPAFDVPVDQKFGLLRYMPRSMHLASSATALAEYIGMAWYSLTAR